MTGSSQHSWGGAGSGCLRADVPQAQRRGVGRSARPLCLALDRRFGPPSGQTSGPAFTAAKPTRGPEDTGRDPQDPALWAQVLSHSPGSSP